MIEIISQEEVYTKKERIKDLSERALGSYRLLKELCDQICFGDGLNTDNDSLVEANKLLIKLSERVDNYLNDIHSLLWVYKDYSKMLEKLIPQEKLEKKQ